MYTHSSFSYIYSNVNPGFVMHLFLIAQQKFSLRKPFLTGYIFEHLTLFQVCLSNGVECRYILPASLIAAARNNTAPVAVVSPTAQKVNQPNDVVIDGSGKTTLSMMASVKQCCH